MKNTVCASMGEKNRRSGVFRSSDYLIVQSKSSQNSRVIFSYSRLLR